MSFANDESLREFGKMKYSAKARLSRHCGSGEPAFPPDALLDVFCGSDAPGREFFQRKIAELVSRLKKNAYAAVPATVFLFFGGTSPELQALADTVRREPTVSRRIGVVCLSPTEENAGLLLPAAEIIEPFSEKTEKFLALGAITLPRTEDYESYSSAWEELAGENGTMKFLQKGYNNLADKSALEHTH